MTEREVKRLRRADLLEILVELTRENEQLKRELADAKSELADRSLRVNANGSIAEAALQLNGVFEAARNACQQYLDNIQEKSRQADTYRTDLMLRLLEHCGDCPKWKGIVVPEENKE